MVTKHPICASVLIGVTVRLTPGNRHHHRRRATSYKAGGSTVRVCEACRRSAASNREPARGTGTPTLAHGTSRGEPERLSRRLNK